MKKKVVRIITSGNNVQWHLQNTLKRLNSDFIVYVIGDNVKKEEMNYPDINFINIKINRKIKIFSDVYALISIVYYLIKIKPDIVHSIMPKAGLLTAVAGFFCCVPLRIHTFTGQIWSNYSGLKKYFFISIDKFIVKLNNICLTDSPSQSLFLYKNNVKKNNLPLQCILKGSLSGVDIDYLDSLDRIAKINEIKGEYNLTSDNFVFSYIARKTKIKGAEDILNAFHILNQKHHNIRLLFVGPDEDLIVEKLKIKAPYLFENVIEIGAVRNHFSYLGASSVLCLPSYSEGFGSIVIDAAALSIPTIGTKIPGLIDSIEHNKTGILVNPGDINQLVDAMDLIFTDHYLRSELSKLARERARIFFNSDIHYAELKKIYLYH